MLAPARERPIVRPDLRDLDFRHYGQLKDGCVLPSPQCVQQNYSAVGELKVSCTRFG
jgi:hypothetical protein